MNRLMFLMMRLLAIGFVLALATTAWGQGTYKNGIKQGQIKVKFTPEMTHALSQVTVNARSSGFTTGILSVDQTAKTTKAKNMYRLFPYDPKFENKLRKHGLHLWYVMEIDETTDPKTAVAQFKQLKEVAVAELEHEKVLAPYQVKAYTPTATPMSVLPFNDPLLKDQWHYENSGQLGKGDADANIFEAWQTTTGSNDVIVSVHDQGVDVDHIDLKANIWVNLAEKNGAPGVDDDLNGYIDDINGYNFSENKGAVDAQNHGTHVAGTIAAVNNNGVGVCGVAGGNGTGNGVKVMSLQILGGAPIEKSYVYAANNGAVISQNSWGYTSPNYVDMSVVDAIEYFVAEAGDYNGSPMRGGLVLFAAGNSDSQENWYPGYFPLTMAVASIGPEGKKAYYSNYGTWVELAAPGGDQGSSYGPKGGVLSTIPDDQYAFMQGTSMACPHMSGIAALALANRNHQMVPEELWNKLVTGAVNIDKQNPDYIGKLGSGMIDAALAIKNSAGIPPAAITNLTATDIAQEIAKLTWTVPADEDDGRPISFTVHYSKQPITESNLASTSTLTIRNDSLPGKTINVELNNLLGLTHYYIIVISRDRWGSASGFSNVLEITTNDGPAIAVTPTTIGGTSQSNPTWVIDAAVSKTGTQNIEIKNNAAGLLRYASFMRARAAATSPTFVEEGLIYPVIPSVAPSNANLHVMNSMENDVPKVYSNEPAPLAFTPITKKLMSGFALYVIGETDTSLPNSAAGKFTVTESGGFNLTAVKMTIKLTRAATTAEPIVVEIYKGDGPAKPNLLLAQSYTTTSLTQFTPTINLTEQLYFAQGESFWVVFHFPNGNLFPMGVGFDADPTYSTPCYYSSDVGTNWQTLDDAMNDKRFVWSMEAVSNNADVGTYLTLTPAAGDVSGMSQATAVITADASNLINGNYAANLVIPSNDAATPELRVPVYLKVQNHQPNVKMTDIVDYSTVFVGARKSFDIVMDNQGYGRFSANSPVSSNYVISGAGASQFIVEGTKPSSIAARDQAIVRVTYVPTAAGVSNATLTISGKSGNNTPYIYTVSLFGVGAETSKIVITPETQTKSGITIGNNVSADILVQNTGAYPLKYFIPGYDTKGVSNNWPTKYHKYGYRYRTSYANDPNPIAFNFQDIKSTGVEITQQLLTYRTYAAIDIGFNFPYYDKVMNTIYVAQKGFTTFDNSVQPINNPRTGDSNYSPKGYISLLGTFLNYTAQGQIFYKKEADRLIIQFDNVVDGSATNNQPITAQMVLFANGDIRFYYKTMGWTVANQKYLNVLIENWEANDGILIHDFNTQVNLSSGTALGFDYPGPNIISSITNGSGILAPGASANVTVNMTTSTLPEGSINRVINFITNDPANWQKYGSVTLDITNGGVPKDSLSTHAIAFGNVFESAVVSKPFTIKNNGTADVEITSMTFTNGGFTVTGEAAPLNIKPGLYKNFEVTMSTTTLGSQEGDLVITYSDASTATIHVTGAVVAAPSIQADLTAVSQTLNYKETATVPYSIQNTGAGALEVSVAGKQWVTFDAAAAPASVTYAVEKENKGGVYQWIDIRKTGVHIDLINQDVLTPEGFWEQIDLPFPFEYYGTTYNKIQLGFNGLVSFEAAPPVMIFSDSIPSANFPGAYIMPYWTFGGFDAVNFAAEDVGLFYQLFEDKMIITWSYLRNNFGGMGDPMSAQLFLYKNGTMKFQYKIENTNSGGDLTSQFTLIGLQKNSTEGIMISPKIALDYGSAKALAYIINPVKKHVIANGETLNGTINFNSFNVYGGTYNADLKIKSNTPNHELMLKPVELTVTALAVLESPEAVDFGSVISNVNGYSKPVELKNTGSAPLTITNLKFSTSKFGVSAYAYTYNNLPSPGDPVGWGWRTTSLNFCPTGATPPHASGCNIVSLTVLPNEAQSINIQYYTSGAGAHSDNMAITTNAGSANLAVTGTTFRAPGLVITPTPIKSVMTDMDSVAASQIAFSATNTNNGQANLEYSARIDYGRTASASFAESIASAQSTSVNLIRTKAFASVEPSSVGSYNRVMTYTEQTSPSNYVGTGGTSPFVVATKYNAGAEGFVVSHVEVYIRTEGLSAGKIKAEIRAGGASIASASKVTEGSFTFETGNGESGGWFVITLDKPGIIYPNENFYVIVTSPLGIAYPQGIIEDPTTTSDRYFFYSVEESVWYDLNKLNGFSTTGLLMLAGEETAGVTSWLNITSPLTGAIAPGASGTIDVSIDGHYAQRGDQIATIVLTTNDPNKKTTAIPVSLHLNEAPRFAATDVVEIAEGEEVTVDIAVTDKEGDTFTLEGNQTRNGVSSIFADGKLSVTLTPEYGTAGNKVYTFKATDYYQASSEFELEVNVVHTNRAPQYVGEESMNFYPTGDFVEFNIEDFYTDPDNDVFTYTVASADKSLMDVFVSGDVFLIKPKETGETKLIFTATDLHGAISNDTINVKMNVVLASEQGPVNEGLKVYPNPMEDIVSFGFSTAWRGDVTLEITDMSGRTQIVHHVDSTRSEEVELNVSGLKRGLYVLRATSADKQATIKLIKK